MLVTQEPFALDARKALSLLPCTLPRPRTDMGGRSLCPGSVAMDLFRKFQRLRQALAARKRDQDKLVPQLADVQFVEDWMWDLSAQSTAHKNPP